MADVPPPYPRQLETSCRWTDSTDVVQWRTWKLNLFGDLDFQRTIEGCPGGIEGALRACWNWPKAPPKKQGDESGRATHARAFRADGGGGRGGGPQPWLL